MGHRKRSADSANKCNIGDLIITRSTIVA